MLIYDPVFYAVSIPAVLLYGIAKGGFAGPLAILCPALRLTTNAVFCAPDAYASAK